MTPEELRRNVARIRQELEEAADGRDPAPRLMAVTKIWNIRGRADSPLDYVVDAEKTHREFSAADMQVGGSVTCRHGAGLLVVHDIVRQAGNLLHVLFRRADCRKGTNSSHKL